MTKPLSPVEQIVRELRAIDLEGSRMPSSMWVRNEREKVILSALAAERRATVERIRPLVKQASEGGWSAIDAILDKEAAR